MPIQRVHPTAREGAVLDFVRKHMRDFGDAPTRREIGSALGMSRPTAELHLQRLETKGHLLLLKQWRGIFITGRNAQIVRTPRGCSIRAIGGAVGRGRK